MTKNLKKQISEDEFQRIEQEYPLGLGTIKDISSLCLYLLFEDSKWITGQNILIDSGLSVR